MLAELPIVAPTTPKIAEFSPTFSYLPSKWRVTFFYGILKAPDYSFFEFVELIIAYNSLALLWVELGLEDIYFLFNYSFF